MTRPSDEKYAEALYNQLVGEDAWKDAAKATKDAMIVWIRAEESQRARWAGHD